MKKFLTAGAALVGFGLSNLALAYDGTLTFNGQVSSKTCTIANLNQEVQMEPVSQSSLAEGEVAGHKAFFIRLTGCSTDTKVKAYFELGQNINNQTGTLRNESTDADASNVSIQLFNKDQQPINLATGANNNQEIVGASGIATMTFFAAYAAPVGEPVKPGAVHAKVNYTMSYE
ncbi:fimbrial protein [Metapseudomonas otitidis]|jgi:major type 1 subunit fimbrin (pilin)